MSPLIRLALHEGWEKVVVPVAVAAIGAYATVQAAKYGAASDDSEDDDGAARPSGGEA